MLLSLPRATLHLGAQSNAARRLSGCLRPALDKPARSFAQSLSLCSVPTLAAMQRSLLSPQPFTCRRLSSTTETVSPHEYDRLASTSLDSLQEVYDDLADRAPHLHMDVESSVCCDGLTVILLAMRTRGQRLHPSNWTRRTYLSSHLVACLRATS